jgi:hypothetical protein
MKIRTATLQDVVAYAALARAAQAWLQEADMRTRLLICTTMQGFHSPTMSKARRRTELWSRPCWPGHFNNCVSGVGRRGTHGDIARGLSPRA